MSCCAITTTTTTTTTTITDPWGCWTASWIVSCCQDACLEYTFTWVVDAKHHWLVPGILSTSVYVDARIILTISGFWSYFAFLRWTNYAGLRPVSCVAVILHQFILFVLFQLQTFSAISKKFKGQSSVIRVTMEFWNLKLNRILVHCALKIRDSCCKN